MSPGVAMGRAVFWLTEGDAAPRRTLEPDEIAGELDRFRTAAREAVEEIERTAEEVHHRLGPEYAAIFHAHALFLKDRDPLMLFEHEASSPRMSSRALDLER